MTNEADWSERLRDFTENLMLRIRSGDALEEMRSVTREGDAIAAQGRNCMRLGKGTERLQQLDAQIGELRKGLA